MADQLSTSYPPLQGAPHAAASKSVEPDNAPAEDLYPVDEEEHAKLVTWCTQAFNAAESARRPFETRWLRYHKLYNAFVIRDKSDWRSKVFLPVAFWVVETIVPRLVAQLPTFLAMPRGPEDAEPAKTMEELLGWAASSTSLEVPLVLGTKSALKYGTGILKTSWHTDTAVARRPVPDVLQVKVPRSQPVIDPETGQPLIDPNGQPVVEVREVITSVQVGMKAEPYRYETYDGPLASWVDVFNFWVAPEATDIEGARYVVHRVYRPFTEIERRVAEGAYRLPPNFGPGDIATNFDDPVHQRLSAIDMGGGEEDPTRRDVELLEFWTSDGRVITLANRKAILRCAANPFDHGRKPFVRLVDYLQEGQFWGVGEIQMLEGQQGLINALTNSRVDNLRLTIEAMFAVDLNSVEDRRDLKVRPGGMIRLKGGAQPATALQRIDLGSVNPEAYREVQEHLDIVERTTGVNAYTAGQDSASLNDTATGINLIQEAGATRFTLKARLNELMGLKEIGQQWASMLQQFTTAPKVLRILGPQGAINFQTFTPESIQGKLDIDIETASSTITDAKRRQESMTLLQVVGRVFPNPGTLEALLEDLLRAFGKKDVARYLAPQQELGIGPGGLPGMTPGGMPPGGGPPGGPGPPQGPMPLPGQPQSQPQPPGQVIPFPGGAQPPQGPMAGIVPAGQGR